MHRDSAHSTCLPHTRLPGDRQYIFGLTHLSFEDDLEAETFFVTHFPGYGKFAARSDGRVRASFTLDEFGEVNQMDLDRYYARPHALYVHVFGFDPTRPPWIFDLAVDSSGNACGDRCAHTHTIYSPAHLPRFCLLATRDHIGISHAVRPPLCLSARRYQYVYGYDPEPLTE